MDNTTSENEELVDIDGIDIKIEAPIGPEATAAANRIRELRERLAAEEKAERDLSEKRKTLILDGTDAQIDDVERKIDISRSAQVRIIERIQLLAVQLTSANNQHRGIELDAVTAKANKAREAAEKLIRAEYSKLARPLAALLRKLYALDTTVERCNLRLAKGGRERVPTSNAIRCIPTRRLDATERRTVGIGEPEHPYHGRADILQGDSTKASVRGTGQIVEAYVEVDVPVRKVEPGTHKTALHEEIVLGTSDTEPGALWNKTIASTIDVDAVARELGI